MIDHGKPPAAIDIAPFAEGPVSTLSRHSRLCKNQDIRNMVGSDLPPPLPMMRLWQYSLGMTMTPVLRVARPSDDLNGLLRFYEHGLGLTLLDRFTDHEGFDGIMLGQEGAPYHFEFTRAHGHVAGRAPTPDNLLIFYISDADEWKAAVQRMRDAGFDPVPAFNPYWDQNGTTFEDPDGYRVVLQRGGWSR